MRKRRTEITIETRKLTIVRTSVRKSELTRCPHCGSNVSTMSEKSALAIFGLNARDLEDLTNSGRLHHASDEELCGESLSGYFDSRQAIDDGNHRLAAMELIQQNCMEEI